MKKLSQKSGNDDEKKRLEELETEILKREEARRQTLPFIQYLMEDRYQTNWHHRVMCEALDRVLTGELTRLMVFMPPRAGKSEIISRHAPALIFGQNPNADIIACSYASDLASYMNRDVQAIMDSSAYCKLFPKSRLGSRRVKHAHGGQALRNTEIFQIPDARGVYRGAGVGQGITGMGFTFGLIDDPFKNAEEAFSPTIREKVWQWYTTTFLTRKGPNARIVIVMTRWHHDDLAGRLLKLQAEDEKADQWEVISFPAICEKNKHPNDPREEGESLWPSRDNFSLQSLDAMRATMTENEWASLYQQRPTLEGGNNFKEEWFLRFTETADHYQVYGEGSVPKVLCDHYIVIDPAVQDHERADNTAQGSIAVTPQNNLLIKDVLAKRFSLDDLVNGIVQFTSLQSPKPSRIGIESVSFQATIWKELQKVPGMPPIQPLMPRGRGKLARAMPAIIHAKNRKIHLPMEADWVRNYIAEMIAFTGVGDVRDDQVDMTSYGMEMMPTLAAPPAKETPKANVMDKFKPR